ncbi:hypothetical protein TNCV_4909851 [Trichonephila clavipes]|uniref:Uncharacterized protein n=1 Tax=Trichonephila clavipes TaxID=2585209 RepID=A0A8X6V822_TRICX|nr:hypothetical protein TNCV_4909851 [Trichonephila clavipes]
MCTISVNDGRTKILCFRDKRTSWTSIRSDLSDALMLLSVQKQSGVDKQMRSKPTVAISFCVAIDECGLALSSNNRTPDLKSPGHFFRIVPFNFDRVSQYLPRSTDGPTSKKFTQK